MLQVTFVMRKKVNIFYDILNLDLVENEYYIHDFVKIGLPIL